MKSAPGNKIGAPTNPRVQKSTRRVSAVSSAEQICPGKRTQRRAEATPLTRKIYAQEEHVLSTSLGKEAIETPNLTSPSPKHP